MKKLAYITDKERRAVWLRAFRIWQRRPHEVAPLSDVTHECSSCKTVFKGNYCPRCGQSAGVGRFSFRKALLLFLDVWGVGNRGMFRSIRDLMLRPGYMIRDYLRGMQSAYFPPFKMFFLLTALALVVDHGVSFQVGEAPPSAEPSTEAAADEPQGDDAGQTLNVNGKTVDVPFYAYGVKVAQMMNALRQKNPAVFALFSLLLFSVPLYFFLRSSPSIPDLRYSEFVVALVYTSNTFSIYSIAGNLLGSVLLKMMAVLMVFVALKQFSGYSKRRLLGYMALTVLISLAVMASVIGIALYVLYLKVGSPD